jgi:hypothetical protein
MLLLMNRKCWARLARWPCLVVVTISYACFVFVCITTLSLILASLVSAIQRTTVIRNSNPFSLSIISVILVSEKFEKVDTL